MNKINLTNMNSSFFLRWLVATICVGIAAYILPGVKVDSVAAAIIVALVLGFINGFIRPIILLLTLPLNILTLGLFTFVINALLVELTALIVPGFHVAGFWYALLFSLVLSILSWLFGLGNWGMPRNSGYVG
jgi:putative membrane protein